MKKIIVEQGKLKNATLESKSLAEVLDKLAIAKTGSSYRVINKLLEEYEIDTSHFKGQS
jgi:hypothetical protein